MRNGQLKPGYNVQIGTENQFIVGYSLHQRPTDTCCLKPHLEKVKSALGQLPGTIISDAGYGGEENYAYLEEEKVEAIVKYSTYHREQTKAWQKDISKIDNWQYDDQEDTWACAAGKKLVFRYESKEKNEMDLRFVTGTTGAPTVKVAPSSQIVRKQQAIGKSRSACVT